MGLDRVQGNEQLIADFLIRTTLGNQPQDRQLPGTELLRWSAIQYRTGRHCRQSCRKVLGNRCRRVKLQLSAQPVRMLCQQAIKRLQHTAASGIHCLTQRLARLRFASCAEQ
ncbi:hypothetical protein D3C87_1294580 [compost metagenome]